ncbi:MAG: D-2-hydroxyacid dehydrogenase [Sedimentibacter sp.]|uniref:D-2-hydroxyacid dehydrogenase n=1 Tax=Sedimentibacter sp. TaxID=1960295 RepID=UPI0031590F86
MKIIIDKHYIGFARNEFPEVEFFEDVNECAEAEAYIGEPDNIKPEILDKLPNLRWVQNFRAGYDNIDMEYIRKRRITFCNGKDIFSVPIAEDVVCRILMHNTNALKYIRNQREHKWERVKRTELKGQTVGLIGTGSIAMEIAKRLQAFGVRIIGYKKTPVLTVAYFDEIYSGKRGLEYVMSNSDYIVVTVDLNKETYHMINSSNLKLMKNTAALINIARGSIIKQEDLLEALKDNSISYAGLDVFEKEPLEEDNPLWDLDNVYITPHATGIVKNNKSRWESLIKQNIQNFIDNEDLINTVK